MKVYELMAKLSECVAGADVVIWEEGSYDASIDDVSDGGDVIYLESQTLIYRDDLPPKKKK